MKNEKLQTKRKAGKGVRKLHAKTTRRKQRVAAAADAPIQGDVPNVGVGRALMVILILHVVAIGAIFVGTQLNKDKGEGAAASALQGNPENQVKATVDLSHLNDANYERKPLNAGDTYATFAARYQVNEEELRELNRNIKLRSGAFLYLPKEKAQAVSPSLGALSEGLVSDRPDLGLGEPEEAVAQPVERRTAVLVRSNRKPQAEAPMAVPVLEASAQTHKVVSGDTVWRIANKYGVKQEDLLALNGMSDPNKLQLGKTLKIPAKR